MKKKKRRSLNKERKRDKNEKPSKKKEKESKSKEKKNFKRKGKLLLTGILITLKLSLLNLWLIIVMPSDHLTIIKTTKKAKYSEMLKILSSKKLKNGKNKQKEVAKL